MIKYMVYQGNNNLKFTHDLNSGSENISIALLLKTEEILKSPTLCIDDLISKRWDITIVMQESGCDFHIQEKHVKSK